MADNIVEIKEKLIKEVQEYHEKTGKVPVFPEWANKGKVQKHFISWNNFLKEAGLEVRKRAKLIPFKNKIEIIMNSKFSFDKENLKIYNKYSREVKSHNHYKNAPTYSFRIQNQIYKINKYVFWAYTFGLIDENFDSRYYKIKFLNDKEEYNKTNVLVVGRSVNRENKILKPTKSKKDSSYNKKYFFDKLYNLYVVNNRILTDKELREKKLFPSTICRFFGYSSMLEVWKEVILTYKERKREKSEEHELIKIVQEFFYKNKKIPTYREIKISYKKIQKFFGTWNNLLVESGLEVNKKTYSSNQKYTDEELIRSIKEGSKNGKIKARDYSNSETIINRFGSWNKALEIAGVEIQRRRNYTKEEIKEKLIAQYEKNGEIPSYNTTTFKDVAIRNFGTWNNALKYAGLETKKTPKKINYSKDELRQKYKDLSIELDRLEHGASINDVNKAYKENDFPCSAQSLATRFGGMNTLKSECGFQKWKIDTAYTKEQLIHLLKNKVKSRGRRLSLREIRKIKNFPSLTTFYTHFNTFNLDKIYEEIEKGE